MTALQFSEDQYDALGEICNLAMGQAGSALATLLDVFVCLQAPNIKVLAAGQISEYLQTLEEADETVVAIRQSFFGDVTGEVIALHLGGQPADMFDLLGYEEEPTPEKEREILFDISNLLNSAVVNGIWRQFGAEVGFTPPSLLTEDIRLADLHFEQNPVWTHVLLFEVHFQLEERKFAVRELIFLPDASFEFIRSALDAFLEELG